MKFYVILEDDRYYLLWVGVNFKYYAIIGECLYYKGHKLGKIKYVLSVEEYYASVYGGD